VEKKFWVGIGRVSLFFRQARSLKDKRSVLQKLKQKLRNEGFSVTECGYQEDMKRAFLGFSYVASSSQHLEMVFDKAADLLLGNFEVVRKSKEVLEFELEAGINEDDLMRSQLGDRDDP